MTTTNTLPPLLGDGHGQYRVLLIGNSGTGKTTLGHALAHLLAVPLICLDTLHWLPGWTPRPDPALLSAVRAAIAAPECARGWVIDGNYARIVGGHLQEAATDVIWLDPPLLLYFPRLCLRTLRRLLGTQPPCAPGCPETWRECLWSRKSILVWGWTQHGVVRERGRAMMREGAVGGGMGGQGGKVRRLGGWGKEQRVWWEGVVGMVKDRG